MRAIFSASKRLGIGAVCAVALALAACSPDSSVEESASMPEAPPAVEENQPPATTSAPPGEGEMPAESAPEAAPEPPRDALAPARTATRGAIATPVIVQINRSEERRPANGGSAVLLFKESENYRNVVTCVNVWNLMDTATTQEVRVGLRKSESGVIEALRPLYWMNKNAPPPEEATCEQRLAQYDFSRAATLRNKYGLTKAGPYFVVARADEQAAAIIDLTGRSDREIAELVRFFRDGFAFQSDIWDPSRSQPEQQRATLMAFFGPRFRDSFISALGFVSSPAARAGCRLGDLNDMPCS